MMETVLKNIPGIKAKVSFKSYWRRFVKVLSNALLLVLATWFVLPPISSFSETNWKDYNHNQANSAPRVGHRPLQPKIVAYFRIFADKNGGSDACQSGVEVAEIERAVNKNYEIFAHPYDSNNFPWRLTDEENRKINTMKQNEKQQAANERAEELWSIIRNDKTSLCVETKYAFNDSPYVHRRSPVADGIVKKIHGTVVGQGDHLRSTGLLLTVRGRKVDVELLQACCNAEQMCTELIRWGGEDCSGGTTSRGPATTCDMCATATLSKKETPGEEKPKNGGCCIGGRCAAGDQESCGVGGGLYIPSGQECSASICQSLTGACVDEHDCRHWQTEEYCKKSIEGRYMGNGSECPAPQTGACMLKECQPGRTIAFCLFKEGTFLGPDSTCPQPDLPQGACCELNGKCGMKTKAACGDRHFMKDAQSCEPTNPCPQPDPPAGACCAPEGGCQVTTQTECGDTPILKDVQSCEPTNPCPQPSACHLPCPFTDKETFCGITTQVECASVGGEFESGQQCPALPEIGESGTFNGCTPSPCDAMIGVWERKDGTLISLNVQKRATMLEGPGESPGKKARLGSFQCTIDQRSNPPRPSVEITWDNGMVDRLTLATDLSARDVPHICHEGDLQRCLRQRVAVDRQTHEALVGAIPEAKRPRYMPTYEWGMPSKVVVKEDPKDTNPAVPAIWKLIEISGNGWGDSYSEGDEMFAYPTAGYFLKVLMIRRGEDPEKATLQAKKDWSERMTQKCVKSGLRVNQHIPDFFVNGAVKDLPTVFQSLEELTQAMEAHRKIKGGDNKFGRWERTSDKPSKVNYGWCDE